MLCDLLFPPCPSHCLTSSRRWKKIKVVFTATHRPSSPCQHTPAGAHPWATPYWGTCLPWPHWPTWSSGDAGSPSEHVQVLPLCLGIERAEVSPRGAQVPHSRLCHFEPKTPPVRAATLCCRDQGRFSMVGNNESCYSCESLEFPPRTLAKWFPPLLPYAPQQCACSCCCSSLLASLLHLSLFLFVWNCRFSRGICICFQLGEMFMPGILFAGTVG